MIIAIIPARSNSKRIKNKNITLLNGKPLINYTIDASLSCKSVSKTIISTDNPEIIESLKVENIDIYKRPASLAQDETTLMPVIKDVLDSTKNINSFDYFVLLQPTSPIRTSKHIQEAINFIIHENADSLISVVKVEKNPLKAFMIDKKGILHGVVNNSYPFASAQFLPKCYYPNGAIYIKRISTFLKDNSFIDKTTIPYLMDAKDSIDIDTYSDLKLAEKILNNS
jgi:CMP-N,N'-diacetyllegionaminic acid synthase